MPSPTTSGTASLIKLSGDDRLDALLVSLKWGKPGTTPATVTYSFAGLGSLWSKDKARGYGSEDSGREPWRDGYDQLDSVQRKNVKLALAEFSKVSGLTFVEVRETATSVGDIRFAFTSGIDGFSQSYAPTPNPVGGDIWISDQYENATFSPGTVDFSKLLASIGQSIGLWRPDRSNPPLDLELDHIGNTVMSTAAGPRGYTPVTLMALDVEALNYLYGKNQSTSGDTTHIISSQNSYNKYLYVYDAGGVDTLVFMDRAYVVDLAAGFAMTTPSSSNVVILGYEPPPTDVNGLGPMHLSSLRGEAKIDSYSNVVFAPGSIENVEIYQASEIYGDGRANLVRYNENFAKWSFFYDGRGGNDTVSVLGHSSEFSLTQSGGLITFSRSDYADNLANQKIRITNVENIVFSDRSFYFDARGENQLQIGSAAPSELQGSNNIDYIYAGRSRDLIIGNEGDDHLFGGLGIDRLDGGGGFDTAHYDDVFQGNLIIRLDENPNADGLISPDRYISIEGVVGGAGDDDIAGTSGGNSLLGGDGNDTLNGLSGNDTLIGGLGADTIIGAAGVDTASYASSSAGVVVDLITNANAGGEAAGDLLIEIENIVGSIFADDLTGDAGANSLSGGQGADVLTGRGGNDVYLVDNVGDRVFEASGGGVDRVVASTSYSLQAGQEIEGLQLLASTGSANLDLTGNEISQSLVGNNGNNVIDGGIGRDAMTGRGGNDTYLIDNLGDRITEAAGGGRDSVLTRASYALAAGQEIEALQLLAVTGTARLNLNGNEFGQSLVGNNGANVLDGKGGADVLTGRGGADSFLFSTALGAGNVDRITDFAAEDTVRLSKSVFAALAPGQLAGSAFKNISAGTTDADDRILYKQGTGELFYDADGSGKGVAVKFAVLDNKAALTAADFFVV